MPQFINLEQNSPDWLRWREGGIGASDCPIILHESPFKSAYQLWLEKTKRAQPKPPGRAIAHGHASEATARKQFAQEQGFEVEPVAAISDDAEYIRASLDGYNAERNVVVEIKCPLTPKDHRRAKEGDIPWYYRLQMQHQLAVVGATEGVYYSWFAGEGIAIPISLDEELWFNTILPGEQEFWARVTANAWPAPNGDTVYGDSEDLQTAARDWFQAKQMLETGEYSQRIAEAVFKRAAGESRNFIAGGVKLQAQVWKPKYLVQVECDNAEVQAAVLKAVEPLLKKKGVKDTKLVTWEPKIVHKFMEESE